MTATPDQVIAQLAELRHDFEKIARIINDNLWHQQEKILDAKAIAIQAGEKMREAITACAAAEAERDALRKALEPFAERCKEAVRPCDSDNDGVMVKTVHLRRARTLSGDKS